MRDMKRNCELCSARAALYCEADEAYICWECDSKVHGANFIVARHYRTVLCRKCNFPTSWRASGARFHTYLCFPCQSKSIASTRSDKENNVNQRTRVIRYSKNSSIHNMRRQRVTEKASEYETTAFSSTSKDNLALQSISHLLNKSVSPSSDVDICSEDMPRSPVSVIFRKSVLDNKPRILIPELVCFESSSDTDFDDPGDFMHSQETDARNHNLESASNWMESPLLPEKARFLQKLIKVRHRKQRTLRTRRQPRLSSSVEATTKRILWHWHDHMNLRSPVTVVLAMHLFRRFPYVIKMSDMHRLDAKTILACCLRIAIKLHKPLGAESESISYEQCTGIPLHNLLAAESIMLRLLNWRIIPTDVKKHAPIRNE